ncbi:tyrosine-protein phosphatase 10D [Macrosteles quadrilineatus]|uniref:tyrosine-protein phosphatase 10D n=1 Tax=Macrosteles quadrilineatus TaxID=74068 RepID=UPI0023E280C0|nr:tyrosine-protein phosphatase 10D [Macrosteles quadrilineatus]XP_054261742.1 tyrosine-protein phosphatase 10D [Macrosteles quadrilineatus]XP_054261743.1 tyrosine-protein phosphatase 10D [Macrosteles quadrilineatus]XP_054261745.1 tyrosine-protein phosphatase 10D [Macrosteles quadrilineatus]XP_054261746.1 tyrosine-protein phosphatase 10D [Macrosteles quadrilineatus]XP_054261747.1 tyrosine-protein phosphatase 10D [Macrosteles quadrilineatus]XP_054261748.1 tyrosine-protein phosphatase 10D [Macr
MEILGHWIIILLMLGRIIESTTPKVYSSCPISDLQLACSSSNSVLFEWDLKQKQRDNCKSQILKILYTKNGSLTAQENYTEILKKQILIRGLLRDHVYSFQFKQYYLNSTEVINDLKLRRVTPSAVGRIEQPTAINITSSSASVKWQLSKNKAKCISGFVIEWCWNHNNTEMCEKSSVSKEERHMTIVNLTPCTSYVLNIATEDVDHVPSQSTNLTFKTTAAANIQAVPEISVKNQTADSIIVAWEQLSYGSECISGYKMFLYDSGHKAVGPYNGFIVPADSRNFTFVNLKQCKLYYLYVSAYFGDSLNDLTPLNKRNGLIKSFTTTSDKVSVENLIVDTTWTGLRIKWTAPSRYKACTRQYIVQVCDAIECKSSGTLNVSTYDVEHLPACTSYKITVGFKHLPATSSTSAITRDSYAASSKELQVINRTSDSITLSWAVQESFRSCEGRFVLSIQDDYNFTIMNRNMSHFVREFKIGDLKPCHSYYFTLTLFSNDKKSIIDYSSIKTTTKAAGDQRISNLQATNLTNGMLLRWHMDPEYSACVSYYQVSLKPREGQISSFNTKNNEFKWMAESVNMLESASVWLVSEGKQVGLPESLDFKKQFEVLSKPKDVVVVASSTIISISWKPAQMRGVRYQVEVFNQSLLYPPPPTCPATTLGPCNVTSKKTEVSVPRLRPATSLWVTVKAVTRAEYGPASKPVHAVTLDGASDPVEDLKVFFTRSNVWFSWRRPCFTNGPISHFTVYIIGTRRNDTTSLVADIPAQQPSADSYNSSFDISQLRDGEAYTVAVVPFGLNKLSGQYNLRNFTVPPTMPAPQNDQVFADLPPVRTTRSTAIVSLRSDLFPNTNGTIRYYAIIVAGNFTYEPRSGYMVNHTWPKMKTWAAATQTHPVGVYQATPPWWNPFTDSDKTPFTVKQFTLGTEECSKTDLNTFCNGPLHSASVYYVRIRAFTLTGYRDSKTIIFKTVDPVVEASLVVIALIIIAAVTTTAFVLLVVKGHVKWTKEKKVIASPEFNSNGLKKPMQEMPFKDFVDHVNKHLRFSIFLEDEYSQLMDDTSTILGTTNVATIPRNKGKDRYKNIIPYDSNLVKLDGDDTNSYINASHIKFQDKSSRSYIACQAPKRETCANFWQMIVQYKVKTIAMLCKLCTNDQVKCYPYFPIESGQLTFGEFKISCTREEIFTYFTLKYLTVEKVGVKWKVQHFQFQQWFDHCAPPDPKMLVDFIDAVRTTCKQKEDRLVVHCSAGVGRTGTFIVVDELLRKICSPDRSRLSVPKTVLCLRQQRHNQMVQTKEQYIYIYKCLKYTLDQKTSCDA